jgi:hypothetical protein
VEREDDDQRKPRSLEDMGKEAIMYRAYFKESE